METPAWTVTIDLSYPRGVAEIADESIHRLLDSVEQYRGALNAGRLSRRGLAITLSIDDVELDDPSFRGAAAHGEAIVHDHLQSLGLGETWVVESVEVWSAEEHHMLHLMGSTATG